MNVNQLSKAIGYDPKNLLIQMAAAGLSHKLETDEVSNEDKKILLTFLKSAKKTSKKNNLSQKRLSKLKLPKKRSFYYKVESS